MITAEDIRHYSTFSYVEVRGRVIFPDDPMNDPYHKCGSRIVKMITGDKLMETVRRWDSLGRIIDSVNAF